MVLLFGFVAPRQAPRRMYPPLARAAVKFQHLTETAPPVALTRARFTRAKTQAVRAKHSSLLYSWGQNATQGIQRAYNVAATRKGKERDTQHSNPRPQITKILDGTGQPENGTAKFHGSKSCGNRTSRGSDTPAVFARGGGGTYLGPRGATIGQGPFQRL